MTKDKTFHFSATDKEKLLQRMMELHFRALSHPQQFILTAVFNGKLTQVPSCLAFHKKTLLHQHAASSILTTSNTKPPPKNTKMSINFIAKTVILVVYLSILLIAILTSNDTRMSLSLYFA